jgi:hypothetical protein
MHAYFLALVLYEQRMRVFSREGQGYEATEDGNPVAGPLLWMAPSLFTSKVELEYGLERLQGRLRGTSEYMKISEKVHTAWLNAAAHCQPLSGAGDQAAGQGGGGSERSGGGGSKEQ